MKEHSVHIRSHSYTVKFRKFDMFTLIYFFIEPMQKYWFI